MTVKIDMGFLRATVVVDVDETFDLQGSMARCCGMPRSKNRTYLVEIKSRSAAMSVIAHEAVHAAAFILEYKGIAAHHDQMELTAYIVQDICEKVETGLHSNK